jgi:putative membrane protein
MSVRLILALFGALGTVALAGCATRQATIPAPPPVAAPIPRSAPPVSSAQFVSQVGSAYLFIEQACALAASRANSPSVRQSASVLLQEHRELSAELSLSARRLNLLPAASLPTDLSSRLERLQGSSNFDSDFREAMRDQHKQLVALLARFAGQGASPTLRQTAAAILPTEQRHLQLVGD